MDPFSIVAEFDEALWRLKIIPYKHLGYFEIFNFIDSRLPLLNW